MSSNMLLRGLVALAVVSLAHSASAQTSVDVIRELPACQGADFDLFLSKLGASSGDCARFYSSTSASECPPDCFEALQALGEECYAALLEVSFDYLGTPVDSEVAAAFLNATLYACETNQPRDTGAMVALAQALFANISSCATADFEAAVSSGCDSTSLTAQLALGGPCSPACTDMVKAYGLQCQVDATMVTFEKLRPETGAALRPTVERLYGQCVGSARRLLREGFRAGESLQTELAGLASHMALPLPL